LAISTIERKYRLQGILKHVSMSAGERPQLPKPTGTTLQGDCGLRDVTSRQLFGGGRIFGALHHLSQSKPQSTRRYLPTLHQLRRRTVLPGCSKSNPLACAFSPTLATSKLLPAASLCPSPLRAFSCHWNSHHVGQFTENFLL